MSVARTDLAEPSDTPGGRAAADHGPRRPAGRRWARGRRALLIVGVVVLLAAVAFYGGGGWYYAGQIKQQALTVAPEQHVYDLHVSPAGRGLLAVRTRWAGERRTLRSGATYGVGWKGGYGQVTGPAHPAGSQTVVCHLTLLAGRVPAAGTPAYLDVDAFPADPRAAVGPSVRNVSYRSGTSRLPAWFVPGRNGSSAGTWAILVHGHGDSRVAMLRLLRDTVAAGLPSLDIAYRNDPGTRRDPSGFYQFGRTEWRDLAAAVAYARAHGAGRVVLIGYSMGGSIVASYLQHAHGGLPVRGVVMDAPMLDLSSTVQLGAAHMSVPVLGHLPGSLTWAAERIATMRFGLDWQAVDYLADTSWLRAPTLVLHGTEDSTVPLATSARLRAERPGKVRLLEFPGAEHVESWNRAPHRYDSAVQAFLRRVAG